MKASIKNSNLPYRGDPTTAAYRKQEQSIEGKRIRVIPTVYNPKPAPTPKAKPKPKKRKGQNREVFPRNKYRHWPPERLEALATMYEDGKSYKEMADKLGTTVSMVNVMSSKLRKSGRLKEARCNNKGWTAEQDRRLIELYNAGLIFVEIGRRLEKPTSTCCNRIHFLIKEGSVKKRCIKRRQN